MLAPTGHRSPPLTLLAQRAAAALERGRARRALELADIGLNTHPAAPDAATLLLLRGRAELELGLASEAGRSATRALRLSPGDGAGAHGLSAAAAAALGRQQEAALGYGRAAAIEPSRAAWHAGLATALLETGEPERAAEAARRTLALDAGNVDASLVLARIGLREGRPSETVRWLAAALERAPERADVHTTLGVALGALGNIADGLREYEWRLRLKGWNPRRFDIPGWGGEPLAGKRLLVWSEQGLGDNLQFVRFTALAKQRGASVLFHGDPRLARLFTSCPGLDQAHSLHGPRPSADVHASLLSLPALLGISNDSVTSALPYLHAEPALATRWRAERRASARDRPRVGLAWQGNPAFCDDEQRSLPLALFVPLVRELGSRIEFVSLQKGFGQDQLQWLPSDAEVTDLGAALDNGGDAFVDSAAALESIDLMLTSDTALAHLAGALARPVWTLLARVPDWRWGLGSATTAWYPTMRLFRQRRAGDWLGVIADVTLALRTWADQR